MCHVVENLIILNRFLSLLRNVNTTQCTPKQLTAIFLALIKKRRDKITQFSASSVPQSKEKHSCLIYINLVSSSIKKKHLKVGKKCEQWKKKGNCEIWFGSSGDFFFITETRDSSLSRYKKIRPETIERWKKVICFHFVGEVSSKKKLRSQ